MGGFGAHERDVKQIVAAKGVTCDALRVAVRCADLECGRVHPRRTEPFVRAAFCRALMVTSLSPIPTAPVCRRITRVAIPGADPSPFARVDTICAVLDL